MRAPRILLLVTALVCSTAPPAHADVDSGPWTWPLRPEPEVLRGFSPPPEPWRAGHRGVDLAADPGETVYAAGAGVVRFVGDVAGTPVVSVSHGDLRTTYLPVAGDVARGDPVAAGDPVGTLSEQGRHCSDRDCLHWGLLRGSEYRDPLGLLRPTEIRLLPVPRG